MTVEVLSVDRALGNAAHHHLFLSRPGTSIEQITDQLVGLHGTSPVGPYLSLRARLPGFVRTDLDALMGDTWRLARLRAMRMTMFVLSHTLLEVAAAATQHIARPLTARWLRDSRLTAEEYESLAAEIDAALAGGPLTVRQLRRVLSAPSSVDVPGVVSRMCDVGRLVGGAAPGGWRSSVRQYHRWQDVLPDVDLHRWDEEAAIRELIGRYIRSYGPVTIDDVSWWTGIAKGRCRTAVESLRAEVAQVSVEGWRGPLYCARDGRADVDAEDTLRALPLLDPYVQGYRNRERFLDPSIHGHVYDRGGNATATLVRRGRIVGVWQVADKPTASIRFHLFAGGPPAVRRAAETELDAAGSFYFDRTVEVIEVATMQPLRAGGGRSASHPLDAVIHRASRRERPHGRAMGMDDETSRSRRD